MGVSLGKGAQVLCGHVLRQGVWACTSPLGKGHESFGGMSLARGVGLYESLGGLSIGKVCGILLVCKEVSARVLGVCH